MKHRIFLSLTAALILALGMLATTTFAQKKKGVETTPSTAERVSKLRPQLVTLKCQPSKSDVSIQARITNTTGRTIPQGAKFFANQDGVNGWMALSNPLTASDSVKFTLGGYFTDAKPCTAYYTRQ